MKFLFLALLISCIAPEPAVGHPAVGIVMDPSGNVFFTDLENVWRISPDGRKSIAVPDVHTHELAVDSAGNLYGEDLRYLGGDRWRHRIWRRSPDGRVIDIVPWHPGFWSDYGIVRDDAGTTYWVQCPERHTCTIRKRTTDGRTRIVAPDVRFDTRVNWIAPGPQGSLYVVDGGAIRRLMADGRVTTVARDLGPQVMGMWPDNLRKTLYVAVWGGNRVVRISRKGDAVTVARTAAPWGPSGVMVAHDGALWILETSTSNQVRARRIARNGQSTVF